MPHLTKDSVVIEVASNDGYLPKNFVAIGIPSPGTKPSTSTADAADRIGSLVFRGFVGAAAVRLAENGQRVDLICGNNVYAHVPGINDFILRLIIALNSGRAVDSEFPHLENRIAQNRFDTASHEHFSYLLLIAVSRTFEGGLGVFDLESSRRMADL
ncbi:hypothetical protein [Bradyrhizobium sp. BR 1432]|uniref:hypothetical protein n=1 Tax=Bradyrhizobium sp. BR 1432 TaxID=3447966 RepID=UPI003EE8145C